MSYELQSFILHRSDKKFRLPTVKVKEVSSKNYGEARSVQEMNLKHREFNEN